jgi:hypothetical protein
MTLQQAWHEYRDACYPQGCSAEQNRECHQAFMAGALIGLKEVCDAADCPDDAEAEVARHIGQLCQEAEEFCRLRCIALKWGRS